MKRCLNCLLTGILLLPFMALGQGKYCTPSYNGPGNPNTGNPTPFYTHILRVTFGGIDQITSPPASEAVSKTYDTFSSAVRAIVAPSSTYPLALHLGNGANDQTVVVWIDYNRNNIFETTERIFIARDTANKGIHIHRKKITVPVNAIPGKTMMRVGTVSGFDIPDPCTNNSAGEWSQHFQDYHVTIVKPAIQKFRDITANHPTYDEVIPGSGDNPIIQVVIETNPEGVFSPLTVDSLFFNILGTTDPYDITNIKLYYTGKDKEFIDPKLIHSTSTPSTTLNFPVSQKLESGKNFFWLTYDVSSTAATGNNLDARFLGGMIITRRSPAVSDPAGQRRVGYCPAYGNKSVFVYVRRVFLGDINQYSYFYNGYSNYTYRSTTLYKNKKYTLTVEAGNSVNDNVTQVWIDYDKNGEFDPGERIMVDSLTNLSQSSPSYGPVKEDFTVPSTAKTGPTRMRVISSYLPANTSGFQLPNPCDNPVEIGEVEDYTIIIAEDGEPVPEFNASTACLGDSTRFFDGSYTFGSYAINSWKWDFGDGNTSTRKNPSHKYQYAGIYYVQLTVNTNKPGTATTIKKPVRVEDPKADFVVSTTLRGIPVIFTNNTSQGQVIDYQWRFGDPASGPNNFSPYPNPSHIFYSSGNYKVRLQVMTTGGCFDSITKIIRIDSVVPPVAYFGISSLRPYYRKPVLLEDLSVYDPVKYKWTVTPSYYSFTNNTTSDSASPYIVFDSLRNYKVLLRVTNSAGTDTFSRIIKPRPYSPPVAEFSASPEKVRAGQLVSFVDESKNDPTSWKWYFGDGDSSQQKFPRHAYNQKGNFNIALTVENPAGKDSKTRNSYIRVVDNYNLCETDVPSSPLFSGTVYDDGGATGTYSNNSMCGFLVRPDCSGPITITFDTAFFNFLSGDFLRVYDGTGPEGKPLHPGNGFSGSRAPSPLIARSGAVYFQQVTNLSGNGLGFKASWSAVPNIFPKISLTGNTVGYKGSPYRMEVDVKFGTRNVFYWDTNDDGFFDDTTTTPFNEIFFSDTGNKKIYVQARNCRGTDNSTLVVRIIEPNKKPLANFVVEKDSIFPFESMKLIDSSTSGPVYWKWEINPPTVVFTNGTADTSYRPEVIFLEAGNYDIKLTVSNSVGSSSITKKKIVYVKHKAQMCIYPYEYTGVSGRIYDPGGEDVDYQNNEYCELLINPCAEQVILDFLEIDMVPGDYLRVYDGYDATGIPFHTGAGFTGRANPGKLKAKSGAIFLVFSSNSFSTAPGFVADWKIKPVTKPVALFTGPDTAYTTGSIAIFENRSTGNSEKYYWDYTGTGSFTDSSFNGSYSYSKAGLYSVRLVAENCAGSDTMKQILWVTSPLRKPLARFTAKLRNADISDIIRFEDESYFGPSKWEWKFNPDNISYMNGTDTNYFFPEVKFNSTGKFNVRLVVTNSFGSDTLLKKDYINIFKYCRPKALSLYPDIMISNFKMFDFEYDSEGDPGPYSDYTKAGVIEMEIGGRYGFTMERPSTGNKVTRKVWIDLNQDGTFDATKELMAEKKNIDTRIWTDSVYIPASASLGYTRMRIGIEDGTYTLGPCGPNEFGEFEDYRVEILGDRTPPVITLIGANPLEMEKGTSYSEPGAKAYDLVDGDISSKVIITHNINPSTPGTYWVRYNVKDKAGNKAIEVQRKVIVKKDLTPPVITLKGFNPQSVGVYTPYIELGVDAIDNVDGDVSSTVSIQNNVDTARVDTYQVIYTAYDQAGNYSKPVYRTVIVVDTTKPVITLKGSKKVTIKEGDSYKDSGAVVTDNYYKGMSPKVSGTVDTAKAGTYILTFRATDLSGNIANPVKRTVIVEENIGLQENGSLLSLKVFPNPSRERVMVLGEFNNEENIALTLFTPTGKRIIHKTFVGDEFSYEIKRKGLAAGIYYLKVSGNRFTRIIKVEFLN